ncbi:BTB and MATH domain-containing protein 41, partial [Podila humilis]
MEDIFCIDLDNSMEEFFYEGPRPVDSRINRTKTLLKWFIEQKASWNAGHEFAMIILGEKAVWHMDFTTDVALLSHALDGLYSMGNFSSFDSTSLFQEIVDHVNFEKDNKALVRAILVYTRSDVLPTMATPEVLEKVRSSGRFYFDCVYVHNKSAEVSGDVKPQ